MKKITYALALLLGLLTLSCSQQEDAFYTTTYTLTQLKASVSAIASTEDETSAIVSTITNDITTNAPVQVGGSYTLSYSRADGGRVAVRANDTSDPISGLFVKIPGETSIQVLYGEWEYTCTQSSYTDPELSGSRVAFTIDLTEYYQALYPDQNITKAERIEYTSHPVN